MSTYLFAFVIANFTASTMFGSVPFQVLSRASQIGNTQFGLETAKRALELYEDAFETRYALGKLDQVALPVFNRESMENYGIVFYREDSFLVDSGVSWKL